MTRPKRVTAQSLKTLKAKEQERLIRRTFVALLKQNGVRALPVEDYRFARPERQWQIDLAWPDVRIGIEVQGGIWSKGAHSRGLGQLRDFAKMNDAQIRGWIVLQVTPDQLCTGDTLLLLAQARATRMDSLLRAALSRKESA